MNVGERDELIMKLFLASLRSYGEIKFTGFNGKISSVGFRGEFRHVDPETIQLLPSLNDDQLKNYAYSIGGCKAPTSAKSDIYINGRGVSLKSLRAAPPALVNHTPRPGFHRVCGAVGSDITILDGIVDEYWDLRMKGTISEDTKITNPNCPFRNYKNYLKPILEYFLFTGTGSADSKYPADFLLEFRDPLKIETWRMLNKDEAFESVWKNLVFSLRAKKGMPLDYSLYTYRRKNADSIARWVRYCGNDYRGALHIRTTG